MRGAGKPKTADDPFAGIRNIGPATRADLDCLGIRNLEELAACDPDSLYTRLQVATGMGQDPCVWDVFAAIIHQARTGEALDWWRFSAERKRRAAIGAFPAPNRDRR